MHKFFFAGICIVLVACAPESSAPVESQPVVSEQRAHIGKGFYAAFGDDIRLQYDPPQYVYVTEKEHPYYNSKDNLYYDFDPLLVWMHSPAAITGIGSILELSAWSIINGYLPSGEGVSRSVTIFPGSLQIIKLTINVLGSVGYRFTKKWSDCATCSDATDYSIEGSLLTVEGTIELNIDLKINDRKLGSRESSHYFATLTSAPTDELPLLECLTIYCRLQYSDQVDETWPNDDRKW